MTHFLSLTAKKKKILDIMSLNLNIVLASPLLITLLHCALSQVLCFATGNKQSSILSSSVRAGYS